MAASIDAGNRRIVLPSETTEGFETSLNYETDHAADSESAKADQTIVTATPQRESSHVAHLICLPAWAAFGTLSGMNTPPDSKSPAAGPYQFDASGSLLGTHLPLPRRSGKVRDVYDLGDRLMIVSTDRISAFDFILPSGIPDKGRLLTSMSQFWFGKLEIRHHLISTEVPVDRLNEAVAESDSDWSPDWTPDWTPDWSPLAGRVMVTEKASVVPFECVVRGYLEGSGWKEYRDTGSICGNKLPAGLQQCDRLPAPIFTPATKAEEGHDENVTIGRMIADIGSDLALGLRQRSLEIYEAACQHAAAQGILIADTKFEFGLVNDEVVLIDEVLTPDSSRFWAADAYQPGQAQPSFDKQFVREWLSTCGWDKQSDPPELPPEIIDKTRQKYIDAFERLSGQHFA